MLKLAGSKRAQVVIEHIAKHGFITTEELERDYGYVHAPRAARDVRDAGIPLITFYVRSSDGRRIAAYRFGNLNGIRTARSGGRRGFPKPLKLELYQNSGGRCAICSGQFERRYLQIDHRVPYEIAGDSGNAELSSSRYMLLCGSCNRAKSWPCEHCPNWLQRSAQICQLCYWAYPEQHTHVALREVRRTDVLWDSSKIEVYEELKRVAENANAPIPECVKRIVARFLEDRG
ncbi:MAG: endonuclease domain-containing protein [Anaerolineae bacterium]